MKYVSTLILFMALAVTSASAQLLLQENFSYTNGTALNGTGGWAAHSGAGTNPITVTTAAGLTYTSYAASGIGGGVALTTSGEDDHINLPSAVSSGTLYVGLLVNVTSATTTGDYFFHYYVSSSSFYGKFFAKKDASNNLAFGISKNSNTANYTGLTYSMNTTYLIVIKYQFNSGSSTDDAVSLFINPVIDASEPGTPTLTPTDPTGTDPASIVGIAVRQGTAANAPGVMVDGIRVGQTWADVVTSGTVTDNFPGVANIARDAKIPNAGSPVTVSADITDDHGLTAEELHYTVNGGTEQIAAMTAGTPPSYSAQVPGSAIANNGDRLTYWVVAKDNHSPAPQATTSSSSSLFVGVTPISTLHAVDGNGVMLYGNYYAKVTAVATMDNGIISTANLDTYIQDATQGIDLYKAGAVSTAIVKGNSYTVIGLLQQYNGKTEFTPDNATIGGGDITDNGSSTVPSPVLKTVAELNANGETYEGTLVTIKHMSFVSGTWPTAATFVPVSYSDDGGTSLLPLYINMTTGGSSEPTDPSTFIGIVNQYKSSSPYTSGYELYLRSPSDILSDVSLPVTMKGMSAKVDGGHVHLNISTATEMDVAGFNISRSVSKDGPFEIISSYKSNAALRASGSTTGGATYSFVDAKVVAGKTYFYKVESVSMSGVSEQVGNILKVDVALPKEYALYQNYPNPFNPTTNIRFDLKADAKVTLEIYNVLGMKVKDLNNGTMSAGTHEVQVDMSRMSSGVYYYRFITLDNTGKAFVQTQRMMLMK